MPIAAALKHEVDRSLAAFCEYRVPPRERSKVRLTHQWCGNKITLVEQRPNWRNPAQWVDCPIAQFRFHYQDEEWSLHCRDHNMRWCSYDEHPGSPTINRLLAEVDRDPSGIFWG
jgi:hypothetical protein